MTSAANTPIIKFVPIKEGLVAKEKCLDKDDLLVFADEKTDSVATESNNKENGNWNILIVDDEPQVHQVTKMVLRDLVFNNKKVKFFSAFSADESKKMLSEKKDFALALIDVVMEDDDAGLKLVEYIRKELNEQKLRIILRTGQPGFAPEKDIIINYDINDYKEKTELSSQKLTTSVIAAIRNYEHIDEIWRLNSHLEQKVADRVADLNNANKKLTETLEEIESDQEAGRVMQSKLFPMEKKKIDSYLFSSKLYPSLRLSGDFLDYFEIEKNHIGFFIADVSGHGVSSAIITFLLRDFFHNILTQFKENGDKRILSPEEVCKKLNEDILTENLGKYFTIFYGVINIQENTMCYINCGQFPYPFIIDLSKNIEEDGAISIIKGKNTPVGLFKKPIFRQQMLSLPEYFKLILFSDGVLEILPEKEISKKEEKLYSIFKKDKNAGVEAIIESLGLEKRVSFPDDLTFLIMEKQKEE